MDPAAPPPSRPLEPLLRLVNRLQARLTPRPPTAPLGNPNRRLTPTRLPPPRTPHPGSMRARGRQRRRHAPPGPPVRVAMPAPDCRRRRAVQRQEQRPRGYRRSRLFTQRRGDMHAPAARPPAALRGRRREGHREVPAQTRRGAPTPDTPDTCLTPAQRGPHRTPFFLFTLEEYYSNPLTRTAVRALHLRRCLTTFVKSARRSKRRPTGSSAPTPSPSAPNP